MSENYIYLQKICGNYEGTYSWVTAKKMTSVELVLDMVKLN